MDNEEAIRIVEHIEELTKRGEEHDPIALQAIQRGVYLLQVTLANTLPIRGKLSSIESWSEILFSSGTYQDWGGAARVRSCLLGDCAELKSIIKNAEDNPLPGPPG